MRLLNIKIEKLYGEFDYDIPLNNDEHIKILTGPNGYGKTMILNIIYNLITKNFYFFRKLNFVKIEVNLDSDRQIIITKEIADKISDVKFELFLSNIINGRFSFVGLQENIVSRLISVFKTPKGTWYSKQDEKEYDEEELIAHHKVVFDAYYDSNGIEGSTDSID